MSNVSPSMILAKIAESVPQECLENIIIIGSLAAGYHFFGKDKDLFVRTKDIDGLLRPRNRAVESGRAVAEKLLANGWRPKEEGAYGKPGTKDTPDNLLPAIRLHPPGNTEWFIELLTEPEVGESGDRRWLRIELSTGYFGLPSFTYLGLTTYKPTESPFGLFCARPEMMALANMLQHPTIGPEKMSGLIEAREIKRANKDLGRVLALAWLSGTEQVERWPAEWAEALRSRFPDTWRALAVRAGDGIRALIAHPEDLEEATFTCKNGLLAAKQISEEQMKIAAERLIQDAIEPLEEIAKG